MSWKHRILRHEKESDEGQITASVERRHAAQTCTGTYFQLNTTELTKLKVHLWQMVGPRLPGVFFLAPHPPSWLQGRPQKTTLHLVFVWMRMRLAIRVQVKAVKKQGRLSGMHAGKTENLNKRTLLVSICQYLNVSMSESLVDIFVRQLFALGVSHELAAVL